MFGTLGGPELLLILVIALIVFGPRKLPEMGKSLGKMMAEFRKASTDFQRTIEEEVEADKMRQALEVPRIEAEPVKVPDGSARQGAEPPGADAPAAPAPDGTVPQASGVPEAEHQ